MSNPLVVNPDTGFLESPSPFGIQPQRVYFNSDRKLQFLGLMDDAIKERKYPDINVICSIVGISQKSIENHIRIDKAFGKEWEERRLAMLSMYTSKLADKAEGKMGTLANLAMLRWLETGSWSQQTRINHVSDSSNQKLMNDGLNQAVDAEIVAITEDNSRALPGPGDAEKK